MGPDWRLVIGIGIIGGISLELFAEHRVANRYPKEQA